MVKQDVVSGRRYDPLWNEGARVGKRGRAAKLAIGLSLAAHAGLIGYLYVAKFAPRYHVFSGEPPILVDTIRRPLPKVEQPPPPLQPERPRPALETPRFHETNLAGPVGQGLEPIPITPPEPVAADPVPARDPPRPVGPRVIEDPSWASQPSAADLALYYPERAQRLGLSGRAVVQCHATVKGSLAACSVLSEEPAVAGFGDAALKLTRLFRMKPRTEDGQAVEGAVVKIPIIFRLPD